MFPATAWPCGDGTGRHGCGGVGMSHMAALESCGDVGTARGFSRGLERGHSEDFRENEGSIDCTDRWDREGDRRLSRKRSRGGARDAGCVIDGMTAHGGARE